MDIADEEKIILKDNEQEALFKVITDMGTDEERVYEVFTNGNIKGFGKNACVFNRFKRKCHEHNESVKEAK